VTCRPLGKEINAYRIFVGKHKGKKPPERPYFNQEDKIQMYREETGWDYVD
jgi:hypothetical protein